MARGLEFRILIEEGLYYLCSENQGADQLRSYLRLCFRICKKPVFSRRGSNMLRKVTSQNINPERNTGAYVQTHRHNTSMVDQFSVKSYSRTVVEYMHVSRGTKVGDMRILAPEIYTAGLCMVTKVIPWCI